MICQSAGQAGQDTLNTLKDIYLTYRTERQPDQLSEDIVATIVPGVTSDSQNNDFLDATWRSLKALGNKHVGPKIGLVQMNKTDIVQQSVAPHFLGYPCRNRAVLSRRNQPRGGWLDLVPLS